MGSADARQQGLAWLTGLQLDDAPLPALTEAISQVCILLLSMAHNGLILSETVSRCCMVTVEVSYIYRWAIGMFKVPSW